MINKEDLIPGDIYIGGYGIYEEGSGWIIKYKSDELSIKKNNFNSRNHNHDLDWFKQATELEKAHLRACIKAGKFVPLSEIKFNESYSIY